MFKGKIYFYKNVDGKEEKLEREFDNPQDFQSFAKESNLWGLKRLHSPMFGLGDWANLHNYFDNLVDKKLGLIYDDENDYEQKSIVDLNKYEQEIQKIEYQKQHKDENLKSLKNSLHQLKDYKKKFKDEGRDDMIEQIDTDIKKIEEEIAKLDK